MSKQPRALELAADLESSEYFDIPRVGEVYGYVASGAMVIDEAAALLRSQHELIGKLVGALVQIDAALSEAWRADELPKSISPGVLHAYKTALSKAKEQQ